VAPPQFSVEREVGASRSSTALLKILQEKILCETDNWRCTFHLKNMSGAMKHEVKM